MHVKLVHESFKLIKGLRGTDFTTVSTTSTGTYALKDTVSFQVLADLEENAVVSVKEDPAFDSSKALPTYRFKLTSPTLPRDLLTLHIITMIKDDDRRLKADILSNKSYASYQETDLVNLWCEAKIPQDTTPGLHEIQLSIYRCDNLGDEVLTNQLTYTAKVLNVTLPSPAENPFYLDLWQHNSNIARKYQVKLWSDEHFAILENYIASMSPLGQKAISVVVSEIPWSSQNSLQNSLEHADLFEYSMIKISKKDSVYTYDYRAMDRYIQLCEQYSIKDEIEIFGLINVWEKPQYGYGQVFEDYNDGVRLRYLDEDTGCYCYMKTKKDFIDFVVNLEAHFIHKGWIDKVRVIADEPSDLNLYMNRLQTIYQAAPQLSFKAAINHVEFMAEPIPNLKDYCPILPHIFEDLEQFKELKKSVKGRISYYVCCWPLRPNTFISSSLVEGRLIPWIAKFLDLDGFLRWNYTVWPDDPNKDIRYGYPEWPAGDTNFVYPGADGHPLLTLRYKALQRGIRDYSILNMSDAKELDHTLHQLLDGHAFNSDFFIKELHPMDGTFYDGLLTRLLERLAK